MELHNANTYIINNYVSVKQKVHIIIIDNYYAFDACYEMLDTWISENVLSMNRIKLLLKFN